MTEESHAQRIERRMKEAGTNQKRVAIVAGLNETYVRDILIGKSTNPGADRVKKVYDAIDKIQAQKESASGQALYLTEGRRFAAARFAFWEDDLRGASEELETNPDEIAAIERGIRPASDQILILLHRTAGFPPWWYLEGRWDGIPPLEAGRAGAFFPDLIEEHPGAASGSARHARRRGGNSEA